MTAVVLVALLGACTPLDGRSPSVEVTLDDSAAPGVDAAVPWWTTTTTEPTIDATPWTSSAVAGAPFATSPLAPATTAAPTTTAPPTPVTVPPPATTTTTVVAVPTVPAAPDPVRAERDQAVQRTLAPLGSERSRQVASAALQLVRFDWIARLPGWQLRFHQGRPGYRGLTFIERRVIEVYVRDGDTPELLAHVVAHELGHAVDLTYLGDAERAGWLAARGLGRGTIWFPGEAGVSDFASGAGDFAESFAWVHGPLGHWSGELGPPPSLVQAGLMALLSGTA